MKRHFPALLLGALSLGTAAAALAQEVPAEKSQYGQALQTTPPAVSSKTWSAGASVGVVHDDNINHLLADFPVNSNTRLPDDAFRAEASLALTPRLGPVKSEISYEYQREDYFNHPIFNYYAHSLGASLFPRLARRWSLDVGGRFDYIADQAGEISNAQTARLGAIWRLSRRLRLKAGYEYERDNVVVYPLLNANSNIFYADIRARPAKSQTLFAGYLFKAKSAAGPDFSYRSHTFRAGLVSHWARRFKTAVVSSYAIKDYDNTDSRFLTRRSDRTFTAAVKPTLALLPWLDAVFSATYLYNRSNVSIKSYSDQMYSFSLQANF